MTPDLPEKAVADQQFARFGSVCKLYAPSYRQVTIAALRKVMMGQQSTGDGELAYADVLAAWKDYLARDNHGRGVVLVGHSQGSRVLLRLIKEEIDGKPAQKQLVSALILGMNTPVDPAKDAYGSLPLCRKARADRLRDQLTSRSAPTSRHPRAASSSARSPSPA